VASLREKCGQAAQLVVALRRAAEGAAEDAAAHKARAESLTARLKDLSVLANTDKGKGGKDGSGKAFQDSYEEVLLEELAAMKAAYEAKLSRQQQAMDDMAGRMQRHKAR